MIDCRLICVNIGISINPFSTYFIARRIRLNFVVNSFYGSLQKPQISLFNNTAYQFY